MGPAVARQGGAVCVVGAGRSGLALGVALARAGRRVIAVDRDRRVLDRLRAGRAPFFEAGFDDAVAEQLGAGNLLPLEAIPRDGVAGVYVIAVPTPVDEAKLPVLEPVCEAARSIAAALRPDDLVIVRSTLPLGASRRVVKPVLDASAAEFRLAYCPDRAVEGDGMAEISSLPQLIGGLDPGSLDRAEALFAGIAPNVVRMSSLEAAEAAKLVSNSQRDVAFALANEVALLCHAAGLSAREVIDAVNRGYPRGRLAQPGPVGGACLTKDSHLLADGLQAFGFSPTVSLAARALNESLPALSIVRLGRYWREKFSAGPQKIAIVGLAYKGRPPVDDLRGTPALPILRHLATEFPEARLCGFDPVVAPADVATLGLEPAAEIEAAFDAASLVVFQSNHQSFAQLPLAALSARMAKPGIVYDYWCQFADEVRLAAGVELLELGDAKPRQAAPITTSRTDPGRSRVRPRA